MKRKQTFSLSAPLLLVVVLATTLTASGAGSDWPSWRGPDQKGVSQESGLISDWSLEGKNLLWRVDFQSRSTPIVLNGRVYVVGRVGTGADKQERVACLDAVTGKILWDRRFNVFLTTVPFPRVGWSSLAGDPETGNIYFHGVGGLFVCLDRDGKTIWEHSLEEEMGHYSGFGGRTDTPVVDGPLVILGYSTSSWGDQVVPRHRFFAFDKKNGQLVWYSTPGGAPADLNTYSTPVVAEIKGQRLLIAGGGDGSIFALKVSTGEKVWEFHLSQRGVNSAVVVEGDKVFATHSEENLDEVTMGRVVCIDATGTGDVTKTHEVWRYNAFPAGFSSPALADGRLFIVDNSANLVVLEAASGKKLAQTSLGTVGKGSPVVADGKAFIPEVNGAFHILDVSSNNLTSLDTEHLKTTEGREAEIYGSPAISDGRIYFTTEEGIYCLGSAGTKEGGGANGMHSEAAVTGSDSSATPAYLQIVPAEVILRPQDKIQLNARVFDASGRMIRQVQPSWKVQGAKVAVDGDGMLTSTDASAPSAGLILGEFEGLQAKTRVRAYPALPWSQDFEAVEEGKFPAHWIGAAGKYSVKKLEDGNKVLEKPTADRGIQRAYVYIGYPEMKGYTIEADLRGVRDKRRIPDMGLISHRYIVALEGNYQRLSVHSWASEKRMAKEVPFRWEPDVWYRMKVRVDFADGKAQIKGKVWPREQDEPSEWTLTAEDPHPNEQGSPGLYGQSYATIYYDNLKVAGNTQ